MSQSRPIPTRILPLMDPRLAVMNGLDQPVWITDVDSVAIIWANAAALVLWRADDLDELVNRDSSGASETARTTLRHVLNRVASGRRVSSQRTIYPRGQAILVAMNVSPFALPDGRGALLVEGTPLSATTIDADVLRASEAARYAPLVICTFSLSGDTLTQNGTATRAFGSTFTLGALSAEPAQAARWLGALQDDRSVEEEVRLETLSGSRWFLVQLRPFLDPPTGSRAVLLTAMDVTERRELGELRDEFVAIVSHELRTPLASMTGVLGLLREGGGGPLYPKGKELVKLGLANGERLARLIEDLLDVQAAITGGFRLEPGTQDLAQLVEEAVRLNQQLARDHRVSVVQCLRPEPLLVSVDPRRLIQVITNLLGNAARVSPPGGTIDVILRRRGDHARVTITDKGPGIPDGYRGQIFEKFTQADSSDARPLPGLGLGLYICRELIEAQGGRIDYSSRPGEGSRFWIELPLLGEAGGIG